MGTCCDRLESTIEIVQELFSIASFKRAGPETETYRPP